MTNILEMKNAAIKIAMHDGGFDTWKLGEDCANYKVNGNALILLGVDIPTGKPVGFTPQIITIKSGRLASTRFFCLRAVYGVGGFFILHLQNEKHKKAIEL